MCGRLDLSQPPRLLSWPSYRGMLVGEGLEPLTPRYNVAPTLKVPIVINTPDGLKVGPATWGYLPAWQLTQGNHKRHANARAETAFGKPTFRGPMHKTRAVLLANGFYEWQRDAKDKPLQAFHIRHVDHAPLRIAGFWAWSADHTEPETCLLTIGPNGMMAPIHDRMPVLLDDAQVEAWLDPALPDALLQQLCTPAPDDWLIATAIGNYVNNSRNEGPECLAPAG